MIYNHPVCSLNTRTTECPDWRFLVSPATI